MRDLYEAIFHRKSIRSYDMTPLSPDTLLQINQYIDSVKPLEGNTETEFSFIGTSDVKNLLPIKAPHYICLYSKKTRGYLMNAGFMLQQIDLYLSSRGLGSCWLGMGKPTNKAPTRIDDLDFVIMLALGKSDETLHRTDESEFKRKSLDQIGNAEGVGDLLEAVRLAPSATNSQPWFITGDAQRMHISRVKLNPIKALIYDKMNQIDLGIALCHLDLAAKMKGQEAQFIYDERDKDKAPGGYEYMASVILKAAH